MLAHCRLRARTVVPVLCFVLLGVAPGARADEVSGGETVVVESEPDPEVEFPVPASVAPERWSSFLPLLGDEAREAGYTLPLPFGISPSFFFLSRDVEVKSVKLGVNGRPLRAVDDFVGLDVRTNTYNAMMRLDAWLLPFLNVFLLGGYTVTDSDVSLTATLPGIGSRTIEGSGTSQGPTYGGGATIAGGYEQLFFGVDTMYAVADIDTLDDEIRALIVMGRVGWNGSVSGFPVRLWTGATYWDTEREVSGTIRSPGGGTLDFEVLQGPVHPWNANFGSQIEFDPHWYAVLDLGLNFQDMVSVTTSFGYRF